MQLYTTCCIHRHREATFEFESDPHSSISTTFSCILCNTSNNSLLSRLFWMDSLLFTTTFARPFTLHRKLVVKDYTREIPCIQVDIPIPTTLENEQKTELRGQVSKMCFFRPLLLPGRRHSIYFVCKCDILAGNTGGIWAWEFLCLTRKRIK